MTLRLAFRIDGQADGAQAAIRDTKAELANFSKEAAQLRGFIAQTNAELARMAAAGTKSGAAVDALRSTLAAQRQELARLNAASATLRASQAAAAQTAVQLGNANRMAAGNMGNLVAQFNDIGMMLAAGQNPLQLALQQGTQISQVIGPMGAAGAVRALGGAFLGMLNPVNLATIATIGLGAAAVQWFTSAGEQAATLEDSIESLSDAMEGLAAARRGAERPFEDLVDEYGRLAGASAERLKTELELAIIGSRREIESTIAAALSTVGSLSDVVADDGMTLANNLERTLRGLREEFGLLEGSAPRVVSAMRAVSDAVTPDQQVGAIQALRAELEAASGGLGGMNDKTFELYQALLSVETAVSQIAGIDMASGVDAAGRAARVLAAELGIALDVARQLAAAGNNYQAELDRTGQASGPDSVRSQLAGGGRFTPQVRGAGLPTPRPDDRSTAGSGARSEADAVGQLIARLEQQLAVERALNPVQAELLRYREQLTGATEAQRAQVEALISTRQAEAAATAAAERQARAWGQTLESSLDGLIFQGKDLDDVLANVVEQLGRAALQTAIWGRNAQTLGGRGGFGGGGLLDLVGGLFGLGGGSAEIVTSGVAGVGVYADGGPVYGPGGPRDDMVPAILSAGEFVVNAAAASRHRATLEAINSGASLARFANGGMVGAAGGFMPPSGATNNFSVTVHGGVGSPADIEAMAYTGMRRAIDESFRLELPGRVRDIMADPRRIR